MKKIYFYLLALLILYGLIWSLNAVSAPEGKLLSGAVFNPWSFVEGSVFTLSFGFGLPPVWSFLLVAGILILLYYGLVWGMLALYKKCARPICR